MIFGWTIIKTSVYDTITASGGITPQTTGDNGHGGRHNFLDIRQINTQYDTMVYSRRQNQRDIYQPYRHGDCRRLFFLHPKVLQELEEIVDNRRKELLTQ